MSDRKAAFVRLASGLAIDRPRHDRKIVETDTHAAALTADRGRWPA